MDGFSIALEMLTTTPAIFAAILGVAWGIVGGALPGISPSIALALLLPFTYGMDPVTAIVLLGATYVGAEYGGSIPAILINTPGTNAAAATVVDGYYMHREGRGGEALGISLQSGVVGGIVGIIFLIAFTEPLSRVALSFNFPAYFALGILGLSVIVSLSSGSLVKGLMAATLGLMISTIGTDPLSGVTRFTFGEPELLTGIEYVIVMVGVFAMSELMMTANTPDWGKTDQRQTRIKLPSFRKWRKLWRAQAIGSGVGIFEGVMPGAGGSIAAFMSYNEARRWSSEPEKFGKGSEEGIAAPEAANNAVACTALVPVLSFGIPGSNSAAILMGGMLIHGLTPGPMLFQKEPEFVYGLFGGLVVANISQLLLGILMMTPALWLVNRPKPYLMAAIFALVFSGIYSIHDSTYDLYLVLLFGVVGYLLRVFGFPFLPLVLGLVLGYLVESNYRRSLELTAGDHRIFWETPISFWLLTVAALSMAGAFRPIRSSRRLAWAGCSGCGTACERNSFCGCP
jgi:putative tricarboxylic transport membrane protein